MFCHLEFRIREKSKATSNKVFTKLCNYFPLVVACGSKKEFLRPGSQLTYIPGGRKARTRNAPDTLQKSNVH